jgi:hypothetical protein
MRTVDKTELAGQIECHKVVTQREAKFTNFVEWRTHKLVYRRYAGLFFTLCVDVNDNELACLEAIHLFVEVRRLQSPALSCPLLSQRWPGGRSFRTRIVIVLEFGHGSCRDVVIPLS